MSILLLNKEKGMTSFSALKQAQKNLGFSKAGHGGTLDPLATGLLPIFFDQSTKFLQFFNTESKEYIAEYVFGIVQILKIFQVFLHMKVTIESLLRPN